MELSNDDLEEYVEKLENVFYNQKSNKKNRNELSLLIENAFNELSISRDLENNLLENFQNILDSKDNDINQKYVQLEDICRQTEVENKTLKKKVDDLTNQIKLDLEGQKNEYMKKIQCIEEKYNSEITNLKNQLESGRIFYEAKEKELYNDLQMAQTASALEWNEKELNLKNQLADSTSNLRFCQSKIRSMQCEMNQLRAQLSLLKYPPKDNTLYFQRNPIQEIKSKLANKQYQFHENDLNYNKNQSHDPYYYTSMVSTDVEESNKDNFNNISDTLDLHQNLNDISVKTSSTPVSGRIEADIHILNTENFDKNSHNYQTLPCQSTRCFTENRKLNKHQQGNISERPHMSFNSIDKTNVPDSKISSTVTIVNQSEESQKIYNTVNSNIGMTSTVVNIVKTVPKRNNLPPLKPCSDSTNGKDSKRKKRRLYDPSSTEFL